MPHRVGPGGVTDIGSPLGSRTVGRGGPGPPPRRLSSRGEGGTVLGGGIAETARRGDIARIVRTMCPDCAFRVITSTVTGELRADGTHAADVVLRYCSPDCALNGTAPA